VPKEVKDYVKGLYGRSPAPIRESVLLKILGDEKPIKGRPADLLEPMMPRVRRELSRDLVKQEEDYVSYAIFPEVALKFFQWRKNPTAPEPAQEKKPQPPARPAAEVRPIAQDEDADVRRLKGMVELASAHNVTELEWEQGRVRFKRGTGSEPVTRTVVPHPSVAEPIPTAAAPVEKPTPQPQSPPSVSPKPASTAEEVTSPMVGTFYLRARPEAPAFIQKGDTAQVGQTLCIVEAMKLMNEIQAEKKCRIVDILVDDGESVEYGQPLVLVEPL